jgi:osmotically-inducible protein OsmY
MSGGNKMVTADQIKAHIVRHLKWDTSLKGSVIKVDYKDRIAILEGTVPTLMAHSIAQQDALNIPGVDKVENRLTVKYKHEHPDKADQEIQSALASILACTASTSAKRIKITVTDGKVDLSGETDSYWLKERIEDLAASVEGVRDISNQIKVSPVEKSSDSAVKKEIVSALARMEVDGLENIQIDVKDGVVTLSGTVPTWDTAFDLEDTARYTGGVIDVQSKLEVE